MVVPAAAAMATAPIRTTSFYGDEDDKVGTIEEGTRFTPHDVDAMDDDDMNGKSNAKVSPHNDEGRSEDEDDSTFMFMTSKGPVDVPTWKKERKVQKVSRQMQDELLALMQWRYKTEQQIEALKEKNAELSAKVYALGTTT